MKKYNSIYYAIYDNLKNIGNFKQYIIENSRTVVCFHFPHGYAKTKSYIEIYKDGKLNKKINFYRYPGENNLIKTLLYYIYFQYTLFKYVPNKSYIVVDNPVLCVLNEIANFLKHTEFIYWIGDYYPNNNGFMKIYNTLANYYSKTLKIVWYVSPPIKKIYEGRMAAGERFGKTRMLVSLGTSLKISSTRTTTRYPIKLGFIGVIREQQGLDLIFSYLQKYNKASLEIVGAGYRLKYYQDLAKKMRLGNKVKFFGFVENLDEITNSWDIGIALYENTKNNVSVYCEPTKIKNYLEYRLPVITTKATYFYKELESKKAGVAIKETIYDFDRALITISGQYKSYKKGVGTILEKYEYTKYYDKILSFMQK